MPTSHARLDQIVVHDPSRPRDAVSVAPRRARGDRGEDRVLVTSGELVGVLSAVRALSRAGFRAYAASSRRRTHCHSSRATAAVPVVPDAAEDPEAFVSAVGQVAVRHDIDLVLPGSERDLVALGEHRSLFPSNVRLAVPADPAALDKATDKFSLTDIAARAGLSSPPAVVIDRDDLAASADLPAPWVVKARRSETRKRDDGFAHAASRRATNLAELREVVASLPGERFIVEAYLPGRLCAVAGVGFEGTLVCAEQRVAHRIWPPDCGSMAYAESVPLDRPAWDALARVMRLLQWTGIIQLQFIENEEGRYLLDLNPRIYASLELAVASGLNLPAIWAQYELGREPEVGRYRPGVRFRSEELDARALVASMRQRRFRSFFRNLWPRPRTAHAVFALRDPLPLFVTAKRAFSSLLMTRPPRRRTLRRRVARRAPARSS